MSQHEQHMEVLRQAGVLTDEHQQSIPGITIPREHRPDIVTALLASKLVRLIQEMEKRQIPLAKLWTDKASGGILKPCMDTQHTFSKKITQHVRVQVVDHAHSQLLCLEHTNKDNQNIAHGAAFVGGLLVTLGGGYLALS